MAAGNMAGLLRAALLGTALTAAACAGPGPQRPVAPRGVKAVPGNGAVTLTWDDSDASTGSLTYVVYWSTRPNVTSADHGRAVTGSPHRHRGLQNGTPIYYRVVAVGATGRSELSPEVTATPRLDATSPGAPASVVATGTDASITIHWGPVAGASGYNLYRDTHSGVQPGTGTFLSTVSPPFVDTGLANGTTYYYVVTARVGSDEGLPSAEVSAAAGGDPVGAPQNLSATAGNGSVTLSWSAVSGALGYKLYWSTSPSVTKSSGQPVLATSPHVHGGLTNGTTYYYVVTAVGSSGLESSESNVASATPSGSAAPPAPTGLVATAGDKQITLSWNAVSGATGYKLYWSISPGVTPGTGSAVSGVSAPHVHGGLTNGTTHYYVVTALGAGGESPPSNQASAAPSAGSSGGYGSVTSSLSGGAYAIVLLENTTAGQGVVQLMVYTSDPKGSPPGTGVSGLSVSASGAVTGALASRGGGVYGNNTAKPLAAGSYTFSVSGAASGTVTATVKALASCTITSPGANAIHTAGKNLAVTWSSTNSQKAQILLQDSAGKVTYPPLVPDPKGAVIPGTDIPYKGSLSILVSAVWSATSSNAGLLFLGDGGVQVQLK